MEDKILEENIIEEEVATEEVAEENSEEITEEAPKKDDSKRANIMEWVKDIAIAVLIAILLMQFIRPTIVRQSSMEPTFYEGHYLILSKQAYGLFGNDPQPGEIVVFRSELLDENGRKKLLIKRVIGVPGDTIQIRDGKVYRNGDKLDEDYLEPDCITFPEYSNEETYRVPEGKYFLMGDHREVSVDSRSKDVGFIDENLIEGKVVFRLFPFDEMGVIKS